MVCWYNTEVVWRRIEVVITGLTRNQLGSNPTWVRIPPSPPEKQNTDRMVGVLLFNEINPFGICEIRWRVWNSFAVKCASRVRMRDLFHFTIFSKKNYFTMAQAIISHFAKAKYFTKKPSEFRWARFVSPECAFRPWFSIILQLLLQKFRRRGVLKLLR